MTGTALAALVQVETGSQLRATCRPVVLVPLLGWLALLGAHRPGATPLEGDALYVQGVASTLALALLLVPLLTHPDDTRRRELRALHHRLGIGPAGSLLATLASWMVAGAALVALGVLWLLLLPVQGPGTATWLRLAVWCAAYGLPWLAVALGVRSLGLPQTETSVLLVVLLAVAHGAGGLWPLPYDALALHPAAGPVEQLAGLPTAAHFLHALLATAGALAVTAAIAHLRGGPSSWQSP